LINIGDSPDDRRLPRLPVPTLALPRARKYLDHFAAVSVVQGAQGYGKTTLVAAWLRDQSSSVRSVWVTATPGPGPLRSLVRDQLGQLVAQQLHHSVEAAEALRPVMDQLEDGQRLVLVIDDARHLRDEHLLGGLVEAAAEYPDLHLIFCSRARHPIERLATGRLDTVVIPAGELLLSVAEIGELAAAMQVPLPREHAARLHTEFGGWAAAIRLVLDDLRDSPSDTPSDTPDAVLLPLSRAEEYLRDTVLPNIGDQHALRRITDFSLAERLTHRLIRDLADDDDPDALVRLIESPGLAERRYHEDDIELIFPTYIRRILRETITAHDPDAARATHQRLAHWLISHARGDALLALRHAAAAQDWDQLDQIWTDHSAELTMISPHELFETLSRLPDSIITSRPGMLSGRTLAGIAATEIDSASDGRAVPLRAYTEPNTQITTRELHGLPLHDLLIAGTGHLINLRLAGRFHDAEHVGEQIEQQATTLAAAGASPGDRLGWFHLQCGLTHTLRARPADAARYYELSWRHRARSAAHISSNAAANLAMTHALNGAPGEARRWLTYHRSFDTSRTWGHYLIGVGAHIAAGLLALDQLDADGCHAALDHLGPATNAVELWPYVSYLHAQYGLHYGDPLNALAMLDTAEQTQHPDVAASEAAVSLLTRARADLLIAGGQAQRARALLLRHSPTRNPTLAVPLARISLLAGQPVAARRIAVGLIWRESTPLRERLELLLLNAVAAQHTNDLEESAKLTRQAVLLNQHTALLRPFASLAAGELSALLHNAGQALDASAETRLRNHPSPYPDQIRLIKLTRREDLLATALAATGSRQIIADQLHISINTVKKQLVTLYRKLDVSTRDDALARLAQLGLAGHPDPIRANSPGPRPSLVALERRTGTDDL
jgi:LuxR family maltose regulon positive regulatory protein